MKLEDIFGKAPLFVHAHPDDETLQTGALLAACHNEGLRTTVVTATRGERGEIVQGVIPLDSTVDELAAHREQELALAVKTLGVDRHYWLGNVPARKEGLSERRYADSGMVWIDEGVAGPAENLEEGTLCSATIAEAAGDLAALIEAIAPTGIVSYDSRGSYSHPDHIRTHEIALKASEMTGVDFYEVASDVNDPGFEHLELSQYLDIVVDALSMYRSQLTVYPDHIEHVGGQRDDFSTAVGIRRYAG